MGMRVCSKIWISSAHMIADYNGKCRNIHGHNYLVVACVEREDGKLGEMNMVLDFLGLKKILKQVEEKYDHKLLNDVIGSLNVTSELLALHIRRDIESVLPKGFKVSRIEVHETDNYWVELDG